MSTQPLFFGHIPSSFDIVLKVIAYTAATLIGGGHVYQRTRRREVGPNHETREELQDEMIFGDDDAKKLEGGLYFNDAPFVAGNDDGFQFREPPPPGVLKPKADQQK